MRGAAQPVGLAAHANLARALGLRLRLRLGPGGRGERRGGGRRRRRRAAARAPLKGIKNYLYYTRASCSYFSVPFGGPPAPLVGGALPTISRILSRVSLPPDPASSSS